MNGISAIVYTSNTGFTARYAAMLAEETHLPFYELKQAAVALERGAGVLYLGWLCAGGIKGLKKARSRYAVKVVCAVGMAAASTAYTAKIREQNKLEGLPLFYLRGGYDPARMTGLYKPMMSMMSKMVGKAPAETPEDQAMRDAFAHGGDGVRADQLAPVLAWWGGTCG